MRRLLIAMLLVCASVSAKDRIIRHPKSAFDPALPSDPEDGIAVPAVSGTLWKVRLVTLPDRPWTDAVWLSAHSRLKNGSFQVIVWRERVDVVTQEPYDCATQTLTVPAQPNQNATFILDMMRFRSGDGIFFENWPGYDVHLDVTDSTGKALVSGWWTGVRAAPPLPEWTHPQRSQADARVKCE